LRIARTAAELDLDLTRPIGFVPTMGAFHEGHLQLMRRAREECEQVVVSLFVNPLQFGPKEDFARYPRDEARDAEMAESVGADVLFAPGLEEVYPNKVTTIVHVPEVTDLWEGAQRPGHFDGVATVVAKLFNLVRPHIAFFGRKDLQQCTVVQRMVDDLNMPIRLSIEPTVREADGLAMSSRNRYLSPEHRAIAPQIHLQMSQSKQNILRGDSPVKECEEARNRLNAAGFSVDYFAYVDSRSMLPLESYSQGANLICAARLGTTRLIDNILVE